MGGDLHEKDHVHFDCFLRILHFSFDRIDNFKFFPIDQIVVIFEFQGGAL